MKKILFGLIFAALLAFNISALGYTYVYDNADLLTPKEEEEISLYADEVYNSSGLLAVIVTDYGIYGMTEKLPDYSDGAEDMVLLAVDMSARQYDMYQYNATYGESAFRISYRESQSILDDIFLYFAEGDYAAATELFISRCEASFINAELFDPEKAGEQYEYIEYSDGDAAIFFLLVGLLIGAAAGGITVLCVKLNYKRKVHSDIYPLGQFADLRLVENKDTFVNKSVVVTRIPDPPSNSGGGGSRGFSGRSGGGGSRGSSGRSGGGARMGGRSF